MAILLTVAQVAEAIGADDDFDRNQLEEYAVIASSYIKRKTGREFTSDEPLAVLCAKLYIKQMHFGADGYNREHDYSLGVASLIADLQNIAYEREN